MEAFVAKKRAEREEVEAKEAGERHANDKVMEEEAKKHLPNKGSLPVLLYAKRSKGDVQRLLWAAIDDNDTEMLGSAIRKGARLDEGAPELLMVAPACQ